jgi:hypothetical protein
LRRCERLVLVRAIAIFSVLALLAACGGDNGRARDETEPASTTPRRDANRTRPPLSFRPVIQLLSRAECSAASETNRVPSIDGSTCFLLGEPELVVTRYEARAGQTDGALTDSSAIDVTLSRDDLKQFNGLAQLCFERSPACPTGQLAIVFADLVRVAPTVQEPEFSGSIAITGTVTEMEELLRQMNR